MGLVLPRTANVAAISGRSMRSCCIVHRTLTRSWLQLCQACCSLMLSAVSLDKHEDACLPSLAPGWGAEACSISAGGSLHAAAASSSDSRHCVSSAVMAGSPKQGPRHSRRTCGRILQVTCQGGRHELARTFLAPMRRWAMRCDVLARPCMQRRLQWELFLFLFMTPANIALPPDQAPLAVLLGT